MNSLLALSRSGLGRHITLKGFGGNATTASKRGCARFLIGSLLPFRHSPAWHRLASTGRSRPPPPIARKAGPVDSAATAPRAPEGPFGDPKGKPYAYPPILNIYRAGRGSSVYLGGIRIVTIVVLGCGLFGAVQYASDPTTPDKWLWAPLIALGATVPFLYVALATGPFLHNINVYLPAYARRSRTTLFQFAASPPDTTRLQIMYMRFVPWPFRRDIYLSDLRKMQPKLGRVANLRYTPRSVERQNLGGFAAWLVRSYMGNFYVKRDQKRDLSEIPGLWEEMYKNIPYDENKQK